MSTKTETIIDIEAFLNRMFPSPTAIIEIFGLRGISTWRFLNADKHLCALAAYIMATRHSANVYWLTSPVSPASDYANCMDRNIIADTYTRASEKDIARRTHIVIDCDPHRAPGTAATEAQRDNAIEAAREIAWVLVLGHSWPNPTLVSTGNGAQLIFECDLPARFPALKSVLAALAPRAAEEYGVVVDCSVSKAAQLARLPYTRNTKADRVASILDVYLISPFPPITEDTIAASLERLGVRSTQYDLRAAGDEWTPALDAEGVAKLIEAYPEVLNLYGTAEDGDVTKFFLSECPCAGRSHRGDPRKTVITVGPDQFWFRCWSDECAHFGLRDLRDLLAATGRTPPPFWIAPEEDEDLWDAVVDAQPDLVIATNETEEENDVA